MEIVFRTIGLKIEKLFIIASKRTRNTFCRTGYLSHWHAI